MKEFALRTVLTVTTGRLLTKPVSKDNNGIGDLYELLDYMTGESPFTHTLGRFSEECKPILLALYPELKEAEVRLSVLDTYLQEGEPIELWLDKCVSEWGMPSILSLERGAVANHISKDPIEELLPMLGRY